MLRILQQGVAATLTFLLGPNGDLLGGETLCLSDFSEVRLFPFLCRPEPGKIS